ncbi:MAG TPA: hypothetical protein VN494_11850, partial [Patescibacteria group bacterium]|nr:hypothetical protein [Patescibacteria group bacterium]
VRRLLTSHRLVVATIALRGGGFIAEVKQRTVVEQWEVTLKNREELPERALAWLRAARGPLLGEAAKSCGIAPIKQT